MKKYILFFALFAFVGVEADGAVKIKNSSVNRYQETYSESGEEYYGDEAEDIATLEQDIRILDEEIAKCKKQKKGWVAATVVGSVGTVSTGVAAAVQGVKLKNTKDEVKDKKQQLKDLEQEISDLGGGNSSKKNDKK